MAVAMVARVNVEPWRAREVLPPDRRAALMKLPPFEYEAPTTVAEAIDLLVEHLDEASVLAGGQSLIPLMALRPARPAVIIDINGIAELSGMSATDGWTVIGATTREYAAEKSKVIADTVPLLAAARRVRALAAGTWPGALGRCLGCAGAARRGRGVHRSRPGNDDGPGTRSADGSVRCRGAHPGILPAGHGQSPLHGRSGGGCHRGEP
jgi:FAD binding domain in molybdopterin dehydrogenase